MAQNSMHRGQPLITTQKNLVINMRRDGKSYRVIRRALARNGIYVTESGIRVFVWRECKGQI